MRAALAAAAAGLLLRPSDNAANASVWSHIMAESDASLDLELREGSGADGGALLPNEMDTLRQHLERAAGFTAAKNRVWRAGTPGADQPARYLATVPRSGNTWLRVQLEVATGVATEAVFPGDPCFYEGRGNHPPGSNANRRPCDCGLSERCDAVHLHRDGEPYLLKTHHPYVGPLANGFSPPISHAVLLVRNPVDNYFAWKRYKARRDEVFAHETGVVTDHGAVPTPDAFNPGDFEVFFSKWVRHFLVWFTKAQQEGVAVTMVRFEDLYLGSDDLLTELTQRVGFPSADVGKATRAYPLDRGATADHYYWNTTLAATLPGSHLAERLLSRAPRLLAHLGYERLLKER